MILLAARQANTLAKPVEIGFAMTGLSLTKPMKSARQFEVTAQVRHAGLPGKITSEKGAWCRTRLIWLVTSQRHGAMITLTVAPGYRVTSGEKKTCV